MKKTFYQILKGIEKSPQSFGIEKIEDFRVFINGIEAAYRILGEETNDVDYLDFNDFNEWVRNYYGTVVNFEIDIDWINLIRLHSSNNTNSLNSFFSLLEKYINRNGKVPSGELTILEKSVVKGFQSLLLWEKFSINRKKSNQLTCFLENAHCGIEIKTTRYFDAIQIHFHELKTAKVYNFFNILEVSNNKSSILFEHLKPVSSFHAKNHFFEKRFLPFSNLESPDDLQKALAIICPIIQYELSVVIYGDFSFRQNWKSYYGKRLKFKFEEETQKLEFEKDLEIIYTNKAFPEHKVILEIEKSQNRSLEESYRNFMQYKLTPDEQEWIDEISPQKRTHISCLPSEYINAFEKVFKLTLSRDYKIFLNYIGNGAGIIKLERSIVFYDSSADFHDYIDIDTAFSEHKKPLNITGALKIYDFGCGIGYFIIVNGIEKGNIWVDDRANSGKIYPFKDKNNQRANFKSWVKTFGLKNDCASISAIKNNSASFPSYIQPTHGNIDTDLPF